MAINPIQNQTFEDFLLSPPGDRLIRFNVSRNTLIAFVVSLIIHAVILFFVFPKVEFEKSKNPTTFEVVLAQPQQAKVVAELLPQEAIPEPLPEPDKPKKIIAQKPNKKLKPPIFKVPEVLATNKHTPETLLQSENKPKEAPFDMMAAINAKRAEREGKEAEAAKINAEAAAREAGPTEEQKRDAKIRSNFQNGTNGIFEILRVDGNNASFTFHGWLNDYSTAKRQYFEVDANTGQDVRLVMIRRMIRLIREHYQGDFNWESHRLGRTVVKSARVEDGAELEDFLMTEFFGPNYKAAI
jgi:hypothetical protein